LPLPLPLPPPEFPLPLPSLANAIPEVPDAMIVDSGVTAIAKATTPRPIVLEMLIGTSSLNAAAPSLGAPKLL
jgi:hypothetical protein